MCYVYEMLEKCYDYEMLEIVLVYEMLENVWRLWDAGKYVTFMRYWKMCYVYEMLENMLRLWDAGKYGKAGQATDDNIIWIM